MSGDGGPRQPRRRARFTFVAWLVALAVAGLGLALGADMSPGSPFRLGSIAAAVVIVLVATALRRRRDG